MMVTAKRARLTGLVMLVIMFAVGTLTGAATMHVVEGETAQGSGGDDDSGPGFFETLALTPEQQAEVDAIMERRRGEMDAFWKEHGPTLRAITDSARLEIRAVLTPEQRETEERYRAERRRRSGHDNPQDQGTSR